MSSFILFKMNGFGAFDIKLFIFSLTVWMTLLWAGFAHGQTVIYQDDFEGPVSGWSDNRTDSTPAVTTFLGRFGTGQTTTSRSFTVPPNTDELVIEFDLYRFDSWDNTAEFGFDRFEVEIDGGQIFSLPFQSTQAARSGTSGNVDWSHTPLTEAEELGFNSAQFRLDQLHRFEIIVNNPGASVDLTLSAALNQSLFDESGGYDNFLVTADVDAGGTNPGGAGGFCPAGTNETSGTFHVLSATGGDNPNNAVSTPLPEGSQDTGGNSGTTFFPSVIYDLTNDSNTLVPEGTVIEVSLGDHFSSGAQVVISSALENSNFPPAGSTGAQTVNLNSNNNTFNYFDYTVPAGGARFIELDHQFGGIRFDGVIFDTLCTPPPAVTVEAENDNGFVADSSFGNTPVLNVLGNDAIDGTTPPTAFDLALAPGSSLPSGLSFDLATGAVEVLQDTLTGVYSFDYELCQAGLPTNCDTAMVTINVTNPNPPMICPAGSTPIAGTFHVVGVTPVNGSPTNPNGALGAPLPEGSQDNNSNVSGVTFFQNLIYDLTGDSDIFVPEGTAIDVSLANHFNSNAIGNISTSLDGNNYTPIGTSNAPWVNNTFRYDEYIVPNGGARFLQIEYGFGGGLRFDGVIYNTQCGPPSAVTVEAENDNGAVSDSSLGNTPVLNVLSNDAIDGTTPPTAFDLALAPGSSLPSGLSFDLATGAVEVLQDTLTGVYSFDYELCQAGLPTNCDTAMVTINVTNPNPPMICPAGSTPIAGTFHVVGVTPVNGSPTNPNGALGAPLPEGSQDNNSNVSGVTFFQNLIYDLTGDSDIFVPEGTAIDVSLANHFNSNAIGNISTSLDGNNYTPIGTSNAPWVNNTFRYDEYIVPNGGARFLQIEYGFGGGLRFDGVIYNTQCEPGGAVAPSLNAAKTVDVYDPQALGLYAIPGNDVIYTITVENTGAGDVDSGSLILIDSMPPEVSYFNGDIDDGGPETNPVAFETTSTGLTLDFNADVGFSDAATKPTDFANCTYTPIAGYDPDVTYICFNPKGVLSGQSTMSVSFRSRIE